MADRLSIATDLLVRAANHMADGPVSDTTWWRDYFLFTGEHMILTDEGWESGESKQAYIESYAKDDETFEPLDEVNAPIQKEIR